MPWHFPVPRWWRHFGFSARLERRFWSLGALLANGDMASVILFGGLLAYALAHLVIGTLNGIGRAESFVEAMTSVL